MPTHTSETDDPWTVRRLLGWTQERFEAEGIESPRVDAEHLLSFALACSRMSLYLDHDKVVEAPERARYRELVKRRLAREPVAYIEGKRGFHALGLELHVDRRVLIPRPETELLVDWVLEDLTGPRKQPDWEDERVGGDVAAEAESEPTPATSAATPTLEPTLAERAAELVTPEPPPPPDERAVLDVGTGSGAIALALKHARPSLRVTACDVSEDALAVARDNAQRLGLTVPMLRSDLLADVPVPDGGFTVITANLPYVREPVWRTLSPEVQRFEPRLALDGGEDGLTVIRRLVAAAPARLAPGGALYLEIGYDQGGSVPALLAAHGFVDVAMRKDYAGHPRIVRGRLPGPAALVGGRVDVRGVHPLERLLAHVVAWAEPRSDVIGVALVGSHAKGTARDGSDVDVVLVVESMDPYLEDDAWLGSFGELASLHEEDYGLVRSRRAVYRDGLEVEWGLADRRWLRIPPDSGTAAVVRDGMRILHDPSGGIAALRRAATGTEHGRVG